MKFQDFGGGFSFQSRASMGLMDPALLMNFILPQLFSTLARVLCKLNPVAFHGYGGGISLRGLNFLHCGVGTACRVLCYFCLCGPSLGGSVWPILIMMLVEKQGVSQ